MSSLRLVSFLPMLSIAAALGVLRSPAAGLFAETGTDAGQEGTIRSLPEACSHFPASPFYMHGKFEDNAYSQNFNFNNTDLLTIEPSAYGFQSLLPVLHKLATGKSVRVSVLGGSFTAGVYCEQGIFSRRGRGKPCSWPDRLLEWLHLAFPAADVKLENFGRGGATSAVILAGIGITLITAPDQHPPDLIILDTLVNDAFEARAWVDDSIKESHEDGDIVSISYEKLVRSIQELYPEASLLSILAGCEVCRKTRPVQAKVIEYYGLPVVDFASVVEHNPGLWQPTHQDVHPSWKTHQALTDMISYMLGKTWHDFCSLGAPEKSLRPVPTSRKKPLWPAKDLDRFSACLRPISIYQARDPRDKPIVTEGSWTLYEDSPSKPGWISTTAGSKLRFPLQFGKQPRLTIEFLRSYEGMGNVRLTMNRKQATLAGMWRVGHDRVSQSYVTNFDAGAQLSQPLFGEDGVMGFGIPPMANATLEVEVLPPQQKGSVNKFKIITVLSC